MNKQKAICILGGMGPQASARFLVDVVDMAARDFGASNNEDFPEIIVDSVPVPDFIADEKAKDIAFKTLSARVRQLDSLASIFAICCNTAHIMFDDLQLSTKIPFVSVIDEVVNEAKIRKINVVGILATPTTIKSRLFQNVLFRAGIESVIPKTLELSILEKTIKKVISGEVDSRDKRGLVAIAKALTKRGAKGIILGCTELPLIFPQSFGLPVFSSSEILARALLRRFFRKGVM